MKHKIDWKRIWGAHRSWLYRRWNDLELPSWEEQKEHIRKVVEGQLAGKKSRKS